MATVFAPAPARSRAALSCRWRIPRAHLAAGAGDLVRLLHPSLPDVASARLGADGLELGPAVRRPARVALAEEQRCAFLLRLLSLCGFLRWRGLGIAPIDLPRLGGRPDEPSVPWLAAPPVPEWCAAPPALALAAVALEIPAGEALDEASRPPESLRRAVSAALDRAPAGLARRLAGAALRAHDAGRSAEALTAELARAEGIARLDGLLGLVLPGRFRGVEEPGLERPAAASGPAAVYSARGFVRRRAGAESFAELPASTPLIDGAALKRAAELLAGDPRAPRLGALAEGREPAGARGGPPLVLLALSADGWDRRSREAWRQRLGAEDGLRRVEAFERARLPWDESDALEPSLRPADVAELLWLPFLSASEAEPAYELVAGSAAGRAERFLAAARSLAAGFDLGTRGRRRYSLGARASGRRDPLLSAAALLMDGFGAEELAAAAGVDAAATGAALERALESGLLVAAGGGYAFGDPSERASRAARLSAPARLEAVRRLERHGVTGDRLLAAALGRGLRGDVAAAGRRLERAVVEGDADTALQLLRRAPASAPDLERPLVAMPFLYQQGEVEAARRLAAALVPGDWLGEPLPARAKASCRLADMKEADKALALVPYGPSAEELLARARVALSAHADAEAALALERLHPARLPKAQQIEWHLLAGERMQRRGEAAAAEASLRRASRLLDGEDAAASLPALFSAGYLASDLNRSGEALRFFARARSSATDDAARANATVDLAVTHHHAGDHAAAEREVESALALLAARGDEDRYLSVLGNRADFALARGDVAAAKSDLTRVLAHDRAGGRDYQLLFSLTTVQQLALFEGDDLEAESAWQEMSGRAQRFPDHPALREGIVLEAARRLAARRPEAALELLARAQALPENRMNTEPARLRLCASAAIDLGSEVDVDLPAEERVLLGAERTMAAGGAPGGEALAELARRAEQGPQAAQACGRVLEWLARFPHAAAPLLPIGRKAAARAGLASALSRLQAVELSLRVETRRPAAPVDEPGAAPAIVAEDESTRAALQAVRRFAGSGVSVLLLGESGTGKEVLAQALHRASGRRPFVALNVAAISPTLIESELFGHARGAFTGADRDRPGVLETASGGTLFLDEIGDLPLPLQAKLLRVLQEKSLRRVGEVRERRVDLRVVAATHRDLQAMVGDGGFRRDLFHRLAGAEVTLAPLRERPKDLRALLARLLGDVAVSPEARLLLLSHPWPGNVRELVSAVESARVLAGPEARVDVEHLPRALRAGAEVGARRGPRPYREAVEEARRRSILEALAACDDNRSRAARLLGLSRQSLLYEMKKLRIA